MISKLRTNEQHRQEDGLQNNQGEDEGDAEGRKEDGEEGDGGASEEEFNQHLSVFPELLLDSQVFGIFYFELWQKQWPNHFKYRHLKGRFEGTCLSRKSVLRT